MSLSSAAIQTKLVHLEAKLVSLQQADVRFPYDAYEDFSSWYAARSTNPNSVLMADTDTTFNAYISQNTAWEWLFQQDGRFTVVNTGGTETLWIKIGPNYVYIIPYDKAVIILKGGTIRVF